MKLQLFTVFAFALGYPYAAHSQDELVAKYGCNGCHQPDRKLVGPAWSAIADKYADHSKTVPELVKTIHTGSVGVWGTTPMPPQSSVTEADATTLATWILTKKK